MMSYFRDRIFNVNNPNQAEEIFCRNLDMKDHNQLRQRKQHVEFWNSNKTDQDVMSQT